MAQDYFATLVQPTSQATAEAGANNTEPMTPLRSKQQVTALGSRQNAKHYTASTIGDGTTDARAAILAADAVGPVVLPPGTYAIASNMTLTKSILLEPGAKLKPANAVVITLSDGYVAEDTQHVFDISASGSFVIENQDYVTPYSFGAIGDDVTEDRLALNAAIGTGVDVYVPRGRFPISTDLTALSDNQDFIMAKGAWITQHSSTVQDGVIVLQPGNYSKIAANIDMETGVGYTDDGSLYSYGVYAQTNKVGVVVESCDLRNIGVGIRAKDAQNWKVLNNKIFNTGTSAMLFGVSTTGRCTGNIFSGNYCTQCGDTGLAFWAEGGFGGEISGNVVNGNVFNDTQYQTDGYALDIESNDAYGRQINNTFTNNTIDQSARTATVASHIFTVANNPWQNAMRVSYDNIGTAHYVINRTSTTFQLSLTLGGAAIAVSNGTYSVMPSWKRGGIISGAFSEKTVVSGNTCRGHGFTAAGDGISISQNRNTLVSNNVVEKFPDFGINTAGSANCIVTSNTLLGNGSSTTFAQVHMGSGSNTTTNLILSKNTFGAPRLSTTNHIYYSTTAVAHQSNILIDGNTFEGGTDVGISITAGDAQHIRGLSITNNIFVGHDYANINQIYYVDDLEFSGNVFSGCDGRCIFLSGSTGTHLAVANVTRNQIVNSTAGGLSFFDVRYVKGLEYENLFSSGTVGTQESFTDVQQSKQATTAQLASLTAGVNAINKTTGKQVFNTTTSKPVYAAGSAASSVWVDATGATVHTPV